MSNIYGQFDEINLAINLKIQEVIRLDPGLANELLHLIIEGETLSHRIGMEEGFAVGRMTLEEAEKALEEKKSRKN